LAELHQIVSNTDKKLFIPSGGGWCIRATQGDLVAVHLEINPVASLGEDIAIRIDRRRGKSVVVGVDTDLMRTDGSLGL